MIPDNNISTEMLEDIARSYAQALSMKADVKEHLKRKGLSDDLIKKFKVGFGNAYGKSWITIPVYNLDREIEYIQLLRYPEATTSNLGEFCEELNTFPQEHIPTIFNEEALFGKNECVIVSNEIDAIVASQFLEIPVIGVTEIDALRISRLEHLADKDTIYIWLGKETRSSSLDQGDMVNTIISKCPETTIIGLNPDDNTGAADFFSMGGTVRELFSDAYVLAGKPPLKAEDVEEMSLDDLADVLDATIKYDREVKRILFLALLLMYTESDQINVCLLGQSSSGKTYMAQEVAKYFPEEDITEYAEVSPTAFKHMSPKIDSETGKEYVDCERRTLMFTEMPHPGLLANLRPILSHDRKEVEFLTTDRGKTGGNVAKKTIIRGFPSVVFCSAYTRLNEQEVTRCLLLSPEVSDEKLEAGVKLTGERVADPEAYKLKVESNEARQQLKQRVKYIKNLHVNSVIIKDYSKVLAKFKELNPRLAPRSQRDIAHLSSLIKAVAMLNAPQRMDASGNIIANDSDIEAGFKLWKSICKTQMIGVPPATYDFYERFILPAYEKSKETKKNGPLPQDDGVTHDEISQYYYDTMGIFFSRDTLRKQIIPTLQAANVISLEKSQLDGRKWLIKPQVFSL